MRDKQEIPIFAYNSLVMKKSILTAFFIVFGAMGLMAQSKKADSAAKPKTRVMHYVFTQNDSVKMKQSIKNSTTQPEEDLPVPNSSRPLKSNMNDVIDVEHEIK
jgi:hypothetical protein